MSSVVLRLSSGGESFSRPTEGERAAGEVDARVSALFEEALRCTTHGEVLAFLDGHREAFEGEGGIEIWHRHNKAYPNHGSIKGAAHKCEFDRVHAFVEQRIVDTDPQIAKEDKLAHLIFSKPMDQIAELLGTRSNLCISFWGTREVTITGYKGAISVDRLAREMIARTQTMVEGGDYSLEAFPLESRRHGLDALVAIRELYTRSDALAKHSGLIPWFFLMIRELFSFSSPRHTILSDLPGVGLSTVFCKVTSEDYAREFGDIASCPTTQVDKTGEVKFAIATFSKILRVHPGNEYLKGS